VRISLGDLPTSGTKPLPGEKQAVDDQEQNREKGNYEYSHNYTNGNSEWPQEIHETIDLLREL